MTTSQRTLDGENAPVTKKRKTLDSEYQSYTYIKNELRDLGWNVNNPNRDPSGEVYTQQECLQNREIANRWGKLHPEYVVKLAEDAFWVIEAKPTLGELDKAYDEGVWYGKLLNEHKFVRAVIVTGVAGNDIDRYLVRNGFWIEGKQDYQVITYEGKEITSLLSPKITRRLLDEKTATLKEFDIPDSELLKASEHINEVFHEASIRKDKRATIVATMLLSLLDDTEPNYNAKPDVMVDEINSRAKEALKENLKEDFFKYIEIQLPEKENAKQKFKEALVQAFFTLRKVNIKAAMRTGSDVLGRFYETFLKYGNGAKDLGIVLTPRNITEFAAEVLGISHRDLVYDPTCGTGGFLVSAFYHVKKNYSTSQLNSFRLHRIFGIDQQSSISTLAIVNMIFRGDGKNNIINDDCLSRGIVAHTVDGESSAKFVSRDAALKGQRVITKVLMNPPFALPTRAEKEFRFVEHALHQMEDGGLLFAVLPCAAMVKGEAYRVWRRSLLETNTLLSVVTLAEDIFYPQSQPPALVIIVKKGMPHPHNQGVLWVKVTNDGYRKVKGKRLPDQKVPNDLERVRETVKSFVANPKTHVENIAELQKIAPIDFADPELELIPEAYIDSKMLTKDILESDIDAVIRDTVSFIIKHGFETELPKKRHTSNEPIGSHKFSLKRIGELFDLESGYFHSTAELSEGKLPLISCGEVDNGLVGFYAALDPSLVLRDDLTIAYNGRPLTAKFHPYPFLSKDDVAVCIRKPNIRFETAIFAGAILNRETWRFSYGRKCFKAKLKRFQIQVPVDSKGEVDQEWIAKLVAQNPYWPYLRSQIEGEN